MSDKQALTPLTQAEHAEEIKEEFTDKLGEAFELISEAAALASDLSKTLAGKDYAEESAQASAWAMRLLSDETIPTIMQEASGEEPEDGDGSEPVITASLPKERIREIVKALRFVRQLDSEDFNNETVDEALTDLETLI